MKWISTKDELPADNAKVLFVSLHKVAGGYDQMVLKGIFIKNFKTESQFYENLFKDVSGFNWGIFPAETHVSHWMEIEPPPTILKKANNEWWNFCKPKNIIAHQSV